MFQTARCGVLSQYVSNFEGLPFPLIPFGINNIVCSMKGVSQAQKDECLGLMKWAKGKLGEKYEKAKVEIADNCPRKNQPKICEHVDAGVETICAILGSGILQNILFLNTIIEYTVNVYYNSIYQKLSTIPPD